jgi:CBS domain containing-hemolysin-like protein
MLLVYLGLALGVSFLCSLLESAILSVPPSYVALLSDRGSRAGRLLRGLKENIDRPLAAILTLNTIAHTIGAAGVGAQAQLVFGSEWVTLTSIILTLLILVLSEIIPKTLGAVYWRGLSSFVAYALRVMIVICLPLVVGFEWLSRAVASGERSAHVTREEILSVAALGQDQGALLENESLLIRNVLLMRAIRVKDIMTPRPVVFALPSDTSVAQAVETRQILGFSRIPIFRESLDHIEGVVHRFRILEAYRRGETARHLGSMARSLHAVPEMIRVSDALKEFLDRREHMFHVLDEFGGTAGIVTLEDAMETLLGVEIVDESDSVEDMRELARERSQERRAKYLKDRETERTPSEPAPDDEEPPGGK